MLTMPWYVWSVVANVAIACVETLNRRGGYGSFLGTLPYTALPILVGQLALYMTWRDAPQMLIAWCVFTVGNSIVRVLNTWLIVGEPINMTVLAGVCMLIAGARVVAMGYGK